MGFNLSAFGAGFAESFTEDIGRERKLAELKGAEAVKTMQLNYKKVIEENKVKETDLLDKIDLLKTYDPSATESELFAIANKPVVMNQITSLVKDKLFDPSSFKLSNFVKVAEDNVTETAIERVKLLSVLPNIAKEIAEEKTKPSGNIFKDMISGSSAKAREKGMLEQAAAVGIPLEKLRAAQQYMRPTVTSKDTVDMSKLYPVKVKTFAEREDEAKVRLLTALQNKDAEAEKLARADLFIAKLTSNVMTSDQAKFSERLANLKNLSLYGQPEERKAADDELKKIWALEQKEAIAKKVPEKDGESKVPALSALNTFTSAAVTRAITSQFGDLVKSQQLAIVEKPDGGASITYIGTDIPTRNKIREVQAAAAKDALSLYTDRSGNPINRDVATVLKSFIFKPTATDGTPPEPTAGRTTPPTTGRTTPTPRVDVQAERTKANAAISQGKDPAAVRRVFKETTGQDL